MKSSINRRKFCKVSSASVAGVFFVNKTFSNIFQKDFTLRPVCVFSKCLQFLDYDLLGEVIADIGFDGADLTVRPGGHVSPENVMRDLPRAYKALQKAGVDIPMLTTRIVNPTDKYTEHILGTAADLGIKYYRMGPFDYDHNKTIPQNIDYFRSELEKFEKINQNFGIHGAYQNHSGKRFGGPVWDLYYALKDINPNYMGVQYDIRHATVEGANSWVLGLKLLAPWIKTLDIKDFIWVKDEKGNWIIENVPLGKGMVDFEEYISEIDNLGIKGPFSIHYEYDLGGAEFGNKQITMDKNKIYEYLKNDLYYLKGLK